MKYARLEESKVVEVVELDVAPAERYHPTLAETFRPAPFGCAEGWLLQGDELVAPSVDIAAVRATMRAAIETAYLASVARGAAYGEGDAIQVDDPYRINISGLASNAGFLLAGVPGFTWPEGGQFLRTLGNVNLYLTPQELLPIAMAVKECWSDIRERYAALKDELEAAGDDLEAIAAVSPATGWPN